MSTRLSFSRQEAHYPAALCSHPYNPPVAVTTHTVATTQPTRGCHNPTPLTFHDTQHTINNLSQPLPPRNGILNSQLPSSSHFFLGSLVPPSCMWRIRRGRLEGELIKIYGDVFFWIQILGHISVFGRISLSIFFLSRRLGFSLSCV